MYIYGGNDSGHLESLKPKSKHVKLAILLGLQNKKIFKESVGYEYTTSYIDNSKSFGEIVNTYN